MSDSSHLVCPYCQAINRVPTARLDQKPNCGRCHQSLFTSHPVELTDDEVRDFSDLLHACHAATGSHVPTNEEWHHRPPSFHLPMPLRAVLKWRVSTLAGFEGGTKIYVNTIDPWAVHDHTCRRMRELASHELISQRVQLVDQRA